MKRRITLTLLVVVHTSATAQQLTAVPLDSGTLVRFHASHTHWVRGRLLQAFRPTSSTLILCRYPADADEVIDRYLARLRPHYQRGEEALAATMFGFTRLDGSYMQICVHTRDAIDGVRG